MKVALVGDIGFFGRYSITGNRGVYDYFSDVAEYLSSFDYVVGNLETPLTRREKPHGPKSAHIKSDPANAELLRWMGVDAVNLANNHMFDYGRRGYRDTMDNLDALGVKYFGVEGLEEQFTDATAKIALHGYCSYDTNPLEMGPAGINTLNVPRVAERMTYYHNAGHLNIVSIHSGEEHVNYPSRTDIEMARYFASICPYVYFGHHPHVVQGVERYSESVLAYSLGNFCFDDVYTPKSLRPLVTQSENNRRGLILELNVVGASVVDLVATPTYAGAERLEIRIVDRADDDLRRYTEALSIPEPRYTTARHAEIQKRLKARHAARDFTWYVKRLNLTSIRLLARARYNSVMHTRNVVKPLARITTVGGGSAGSVSD